MTKRSGEPNLEKYADSYHMVLYDAGIVDHNIMVYSSILPATARLVLPDEVDMPPFGLELETIMPISHDTQGELVSAGVVCAWIYKDGNLDEKAGGLVCGAGGRYRTKELESRLICVINDLHQNTYDQYYLGEFNFITEGVTVTKRYGTVLVGLCFVGLVLPESPMKDKDRSEII